MPSVAAVTAAIATAAIADVAMIVAAMWIAATETWKIIYGGSVASIEFISSGISCSWTAAI